MHQFLSLDPPVLSVKNMRTVFHSPDTELGHVEVSRLLGSLSTVAQP